MVIGVRHDADVHLFQKQRYLRSRDETGNFNVVLQLKFIDLSFDNHSLGTVESRKQSEPSGWNSTAAARDTSGQVVVFLERWPAGSELPLIVFQPGAPGNLAELATVSRSRDVLLVEFANTLEGQPFAKMLVLAAVLAADD